MLRIGFLQRGMRLEWLFIDDVLQHNDGILRKLSRWNRQLQLRQHLRMRDLFRRLLFGNNMYLSTALNFNSRFARRSFMKQITFTLLCIGLWIFFGCGHTETREQTSTPVSTEGSWWSPTGGELCPMFGTKDLCEKMTKKFCIERFTRDHGGWPNCKK